MIVVEVQEMVDKGKTKEKNACNVGGESLNRMDYAIAQRTSLD